MIKDFLLWRTYIEYLSIFPKSLENKDVSRIITCC